MLALAIHQEEGTVTVAMQFQALIAKSQINSKFRRRSAVRTAALFLGICGLGFGAGSIAHAQSSANVQPRPVGVVVDSPAISITTATATSASTPTTGAHEAQIQWKFGTVAGTYSSCTVQAKTSYDGGSTWLTLGGAASLTVSSGVANAWTLIEQLGTTSVTTSAVSSTAALGFGSLTEFVFTCSSYGTSAPVTIAVIYK